MVQRRLARRIREGGRPLHDRHMEAVHRADVDDSCGHSGAARRGQQRREIARQGELGVDIGVHDLGKAGVGVVFQLRAPVRARVVDQQI